MDTPASAILLRIIVSESDTWHGKSLYKSLVEAARRHGLAGATVLAGIGGYGAHGRIHSAGLVDFSPDLPMIVEIFDDEAKIQAFLPTVKTMVHSGLVTAERVTVLAPRVLQTV